MPRRKIMKKKKYTNKGRYIAKIARTVANKVVNKKIELKDKRYTYDAVGIEPIGGSASNFSSISYGGSAITAALCRGVTNGTNDGERIGHSIMLKGVYINFAVQNADQYNNIRFIVMRPDGREPQTSVTSWVQSIFSGATSSGTQWLQPVDTDYYKVYYDKTLALRSQDLDGSSSVVQTRMIKKFIKFPRGIKMEWDEQNSRPNRDVYIVAISDSVAVAHPGVVAGFVRIYYTDA